MTRRTEKQWAIQLTDPHTNKPMIRDHWTDPTRLGRGARPFTSFEDAQSQAGMYQSRYNPTVVERTVFIVEGPWLEVVP